MNTEQLLSSITINPKIMRGKPTIRGMRITVEQILKALSGGVSEDELIEDYPELEKEDFLAIFAYMFDLIEEEQVFFARICIRPIDVNRVIQRATDDDCTRTSNQRSVANAEILLKTSFVGCGEALSKLSTDYKSELYHIIAQKHGDC